MGIIRNIFKGLILSFVIVGTFIMNLIGAIICAITE